MSNLNYKNPLTSNQISAQQSVPVNSVFGVTYSVLNTGGFMEVYNLSDLKFNYAGGTGLITGSTIPINFSKGTNTTFNPDVLTLSSDNISSGRRRLGMHVYVHDVSFCTRDMVNLSIYNSKLRFIMVCSNCSNR